MTLSELSDSCETCGERSVFTGDVKVIGERTYAILRCPSCHEVFPVWNKATAEMVAAWKPSAALRATMVAMQGGPDEVARCLANPPAEMPFWRLTDLRVPAASARNYCRLVLEHHGLVPTGTVADRIEEALAVAIQFGDAACAAGAIGRLEEASAADILAVLLRMPARAGEKSGAPIIPFVAALRERGGEFAEAVAVADKRWALPGLRLALI